MQNHDVYIIVHSARHGIDFDVRFHDGCVKSFKLDEYELASHRMPERMVIECKVEEYYEDVYGYVPEINYIFY